MLITQKGKGFEAIQYLECDGSNTTTHRTECEKGEFHGMCKINGCTAIVVDVGLFYFYF